jgi:hypothetical protein
VYPDDGSFCEVSSPPANYKITHMHIFKIEVSETQGEYCDRKKFELQVGLTEEQFQTIVAGIVKAATTSTREEVPF